MPTPETILKSTFGYDTFKPLQREIINNVQARRDTLVIMATGGGKSLTYQVPAHIFSERQPSTTNTPYINSALIILSKRF